MAPSSKKGPMKQGTLFSFFAKKAEPKGNNPTKPDKAKASSSPNAAKPKATTLTSGNASSNPTFSQQSSSNKNSSDNDKAPTTSSSSTIQAADDVKMRIGAKIEIYWAADKKFYAAVVREQKRGRTRIEYLDDETEEWVVLRDERWRTVQQQEPAKRRRIVPDDDQSSDEEMEFDDNDDDDSFQDPGGDDDDDDEDDEDNWIVPDDEEEEEEVPKPKKKAIKKSSSVIVKPHNASTRTPSNKGRRPSASSTVPSSSTSSSTSSMSTPSSRPGGGASYVTPPLSAAAATKTPSTMCTAATPLPYQMRAVNPAGSHLHHHLNFLRNPRDAQGRQPTHADYDGRTLRIDEADWKRHNNGKAMTEAVKQWWELKAQYFDTVLLFKTGKFYELYHMDADIGVQVCDLKYMKGHVAHAGFPEVAYGGNADKLVRAGFKVARVEQTERPEQLEERKKQHKKLKRGGPMPKAVNREVCSIMSLGTRTFCYLDERSALEQEDGAVDAQTGPLLTIREVVYANNVQQQPNTTPTDSEDDTPPAACEYGITLVDAIRGSITLGQFADDVLRSRMQTLLASYSPCEIILQTGSEKASATLENLIQIYQRTAQHPCRVEYIRTTESSPRSTALDAAVRHQLERSQRKASPWDTDETLDELHRRNYYSRASKDPSSRSVARWPAVLRAVVEGRANLALSSFGAALFYLQRNLIDGELLSLGIVKAYVPPCSSAVASEEASTARVGQLAAVQDLTDAGVVDPETASTTTETTGNASMDWTATIPEKAFGDINHMALDGTTLHNLEVLYNTADGKVAGSLWEKLNHTKTPHGTRLLRAWLLRPLFRKADIDRRAEAVEELVSGAAAVALQEARSVLQKCGDIERLLTRVHSMSAGSSAEGESNRSVHPDERAVLYEKATYTKRKVGDFSRVLKGLREASKIPIVFQGVEIQSGLLAKIVKLQDEGGRFPDITAELEFFFENFDCDLAAQGLFEPARGVDDSYDAALDSIERIEQDLKDYQKQMCTGPGSLGGHARSTWKYINTNRDSKDKYLIELPASIRVPSDFKMVGKRGSGHKQVSKYITPVVEGLVKALEEAYDTVEERHACSIRTFFAKFDGMRDLWALVAHTTAMLDALGSLAVASSRSGYTRPTILECSDDDVPSFSVSQGRHPCIESNLESEFIPNDLSLGTESDPSRVLLLSGPNMGGKSTILRQTCMIAIMAQVGCFVPSENCRLTPIDRIFTRLGATDKILLGQSTFFVELAETATALRGATHRSLVIMDELGRGTSTFDGQAIASSTIKHLVERNKCLALFATHYHACLEDWRESPQVRLGHMRVLVDEDNEETGEQRVTFLYTLGRGVSPKSFGINVARLAGLPEAVLSKAKRISADFEEQTTSGEPRRTAGSRAASLRQRIDNALDACDWETLQTLQSQLKSQQL